MQERERAAQQQYKPDPTYSPSGYPYAPVEKQQQPRQPEGKKPEGQQGPSQEDTGVMQYLRKLFHFQQYEDPYMNSGYDYNDYYQGNYLV